MDEDLKQIIEDVMVEYGPDGHCDGAEEIAEAVRKYYEKRFDNGDNTKYRVTVISLDNGQVWEDNVWAKCAEDARKNAELINIEEIYEEEHYREEHE